MRLVVDGGIGPHAVSVVGFLASVAEDLPLSDHISDDEGSPHRETNSSEVEEVAGGDISGFNALEDGLVRSGALLDSTSPKSGGPAETHHALSGGGAVDEPDVVSEDVGLTGLGDSGGLSAGHSSLSRHIALGKCASSASLSELQHVDSNRPKKRLARPLEKIWFLFCAKRPWSD